MKKILLLLLISAWTSASFAQDKGQRAVERFGNSLNEWCKHGLFDEREKAVNECAGKDGKECLVYDSLMLRFAKMLHFPSTEKYQLPSYMTGFATLRNADGIRVSISNIRQIPFDRMKFDRSSMSDEKRKSLYYVSCNINVSGSMSCDFEDLFCIRKGSGQISQIGPYIGEINPNTGRKEILVNTSNIKDWDHIAAGEFNSIEASLGYSKNFPLNVGAAASFSYFNIGLEYGQNFDKKPIITKQHTNFASSQINGKYFYLMASPGVFLRFATISYGLGATMTKYNYESVYDSYSENKTFFTMKPKVAFNLPLPVDFKSRDEKCYFCPYVGYLFAPKFSKINSLEFGIGLRFRFVN